MLHTPDDDVRVLADPAFDELFHRPMRQGVESAWYGHLPFAAWIIPACRPRVLVELGTHAGVSYSGFCEAVLRHGLSTRCFAVDTWQGDEHAGGYDDSVYADLRAFHDRHFAGFSTMLRMTFDQASERMAPGSIDLLHIDGLHSYDAVRHDFDRWKPLLSDRAVVMFHDTCVRDRGFGVWQLWQELRATYPGFEFLHRHGLGVLAVGPDVPRPVAALCSLSDETVIAAIRHRFAMIGERWQKEAELHLLEQQMAKDTQRRRELRAGLRAARALHEEAQTRIAKLQETVAELEQYRQTAKDLAYENQRLLNSTLWRVMAPVRAFGEHIPVPIRHGLRAAMRLGRGVKAAPAAPESATLIPQAGKVVFISGEADTPGQTYRVLRPVEAAISAGREAVWMTVGDADRRMKDIAAASVVVIWRAAWSDAVARIVETARGVGAKLVFDVDDLLFRPELATASVIDAIRSQAMDPDEVAEHFAKSLQVLAASDAGACPTTELARHIRSYAKTAFVLPNGFDAKNHAASRLAVRRRRAEADDGLLRIGYAAGTRTHQRDFAQAAAAIARVLQDYPQCRLVLFETPDARQAPIDLNEFAGVSLLADQVEWRTMVTLDRLPEELARFDINIAPLQFGNPFCEAKSELKFFEAALVEVPTIASPTGPLRRAIRDGETGLLAATQEEWYGALKALIEDADRRRRMAHAAYLAVLWPYGPERRAERVESMLRQVEGGPAGALAFALEVARETAPAPAAPALPDTETVLAYDQLGEAAVTVIIPLHNYSGFVVEALDSVRAQTIDVRDLVVVDDASTDDSLAIARDWAERNRSRFNRIVVLRNRTNAGLARTRNAGFDAAETPYVLPLDADNVLLPECCARTLEAVQASHAAFAYPAIQYFGGKDHEIGVAAFSPMGLAGGNYIDAMALVSKAAWAAVGGYAHIEHGWEDYDFWCRFAERGLLGVKVPEVLAEYRVHRKSMLHTATDVTDNKTTVIEQLESRHAWLSIPYAAP
jgi:glycosyltransferase involved in cell wall biosynthesis